MNSSLISKIEKARRYAEEPSRVRVNHIQVDFRGDNNVHSVELADGEWKCSCSFFGTWGTCSHTMAMRKLLGEMITDTEEAVQAETVVSAPR